MTSTDITVCGAREHNLRNVSLSLPRNRLIVMTGVSGSGKSSLAFDTLYAEGQRRYVESLSTYARQFLGQLPRPDVDSISGLAPSISIQQKSTSRNPRSTVGTITEIYDYLRVLYARVGLGYCSVSGRPIRAQSVDQIIDSISSLPDGTRFAILAPVIQNQKGEFRDLFSNLQKRGFLRARVDGRFVSLSEDLRLRRHHRHSVEVVIDRLISGPAHRARLAEAVEQALDLGDGRLICTTWPDGTASARPGDSEKDDGPLSSGIDRLYSTRYSCPESGRSYEPPTPQLFSFNSPAGMCPDCNGLGVRHGLPDDVVVVSEKKSIQSGALLLLPSLRRLNRWSRHILKGAAAAIEKDTGLPSGTLLKTKWKDLPEDAQRMWLHGTGDRHITFTYGHRGGSWKHGGRWEGWIPRLLDEYRTSRNPLRRRQIEKHLEIVRCGSCGGTRLNEQARHVRIRTNSRRFGGRHRHGKELSLPEVCSLTISEAAEFFSSLKLDDVQQYIAEEALKEIRGRLGFLLQCGLHYLTLDRAAPTLSGGEMQRIRLAGQIGCGLVGVVYILDEPSIGLHPRDNRMLLDSLKRLRDQGNTVIVVEHDEDTIRAADHIVDFGPGPGSRGGQVVFSGSLSRLLKADRSVTGQYLSGKQRIEVPDHRRGGSGAAITVRGARHNNLKEIDVSFPLGRFICVTGVSGSGKSSLVSDILWPVLNRDVNQGRGEPGDHDQVTGLDRIDRAIDIDQSPIGRTPRSNPATYVKVFDEIRRLFAELPASRMRGYRPGRFSFNVASGRCEACEGHGATRLEMDFLADIWVPCDVCQGRRFSQETLDVTFRDHSIADVLRLEVRDALALFENVPRIHRLLKTLCDVGLDYMQLGQPSPTLSGGEAQRIKLARELGKRSTGRTLYVLDEPTTGLHFADVHRLLQVLHGFVDAGNTVIVVEHNLDVIKTADWIIDMGPEGGAGGGTIVCEGTPEAVAASRRSHTGAALRPLLGLKPWHRRTSSGERNGTHRSGDPFVFSDRIRITGAAQHNLQNIDLQLPRNTMSVFCGPSGSGKTSLAMDTLYAEGQRRYVESLSAYARQFLGRMPRPKVDSIQGLSPAVAIEQKTTGSTPRSTVGTVTEIHDYLRVLYARLGTVHCPTCGRQAQQQTTDEIVQSLLKFPQGTRLLLLAPYEVDRQTSYETAFRRLQSDGFVRVRIDGTTHSLDAVPKLTHQRTHDVEVVVDRVVVDGRARSRITDSVEAALHLGQGVLSAAVADSRTAECDWDTHLYSLHLSCFECGYSYDRPGPQQFSFNSPLGWCPSCEGLGTEYGASQALLVTSPERSLREGAIGAWPDPERQAVFGRLLEAVARAFGVSLDEPWYRLTADQQRRILYGDDNCWIDVPSEGAALRIRYRGIYPAMEQASRLSWDYRKRLADMAGEKDCSACGGTRLNEIAAAVQLNGVTLPQLSRMPLEESLKFLRRLKLTAAQKRIAGDLLKEAVHRLTFLNEVGLNYLTLDRSMPTLSGGESQRIRLAGQVGRSLTGVLYVLDEPTIGLHPRDNGRLLNALRRLRDLGNTVLLVEHDREVLQAADRLYDFGPGAGRLGGVVVAEGTPRQLSRQTKKSLTGRYLGGRQDIPVPEQRRILSETGADVSSASSGKSRRKKRRRNGSSPAIPKTDRPLLQLLGAGQHNLRNVDLMIPLGTFTCITGVSGSGKSSLIINTLAPAVARRLGLAAETPGPYRELLGMEHLSRICVVDQNPIGSTPASNPATYTGVFDSIRELFCRMPEARVRGYRPGRFSFNRAGGRCDDCEGMGQKKIEMHFLPDVWVECSTCRGRRYNSETLTVTFRGFSIADVLDMSVDRALDVFADVPRIRAPLSILAAIGLGYLRLGQSAPTLSGGEAQRLRLAAELSRPRSGHTLFLLDEPTTGLHFDDIVRLLSVLNSLVEQGHTVVVIEHNLDVIKTADWIVDLGPEAGAAGGQIVAAGTPEDVAAQAVSLKKSRSGRRSWTGELLGPVLNTSKRGRIEVFDVRETAEDRTNGQKDDLLQKETRLPWEVDGRKWHLEQCVSANGRRCRWDAEALKFVTDLLAQDSRLKPAVWNHRSIVEVRATDCLGWLLHARTGHEWLLTLCFRVRRGTFDAATLSDQLCLTPIDDVEDMHYYSTGPRIRVRRAAGGWQEVSIKVWKKDEIDTAAFRKFLQTAVESWLSRAEKAQQRPADLMPWKHLGRKWHLMKKGLPARGRVGWTMETLERLLPEVEAAFADAEVDYGLRTRIRWKSRDGSPAAELHTKRKDGVHLILFVPTGSVAVGAIADLGADRTIRPHRSDLDAVRFRFTEADQVSDAFRRWLTDQPTPRNAKEE